MHSQSLFVRKHSNHLSTEPQISNGELCPPESWVRKHHFPEARTVRDGERVLSTLLPIPKGSLGKAVAHPGLSECSRRRGEMHPPSGMRRELNRRRDQHIFGLRHHLSPERPNYPQLPGFHCRHICLVCSRQLSPIRSHKSSRRLASPTV